LDAKSYGVLLIYVLVLLSDLINYALRGCWSLFW